MIDKKYIDALEACSRCRCGCCKDGCPVYNVMLEEQVSARGRNLIIRAYLSALIEPSPRLARAVYSCLLCRLDEENCTARIPNAEIYEHVRELLVSRDIGPMPEHEQLLASLRNYGNPWMQPASARDRWTRKAGSKSKTDAGKGLLYFAGCTFSLDPSIQTVPAATARLLNMAGVEFDLLGKDELCCGSTALRIGDRQLFDELRKENLGMLSSYDEVVTSCSGCYKTMNQDYGESDSSPKFSHSVELLANLIREKKLDPKRIDAKVTYH
ncbi:MAG: (Fe-S)-binding protein, partial [Thermoplasmata archaeon]|nr:(Fe-S)-binding protein [Thermoplasmata archaeon]